MKLFDLILVFHEGGVHIFLSSRQIKEFVSFLFITTCCSSQAMQARVANYFGKVASSRPLACLFVAHVKPRFVPTYLFPVLRASKRALNWSEEMGFQITSAKPQRMWFSFLSQDTSTPKTMWFSFGLPFATPEKRTGLKPKGGPGKN